MVEKGEKRETEREEREERVETQACTYLYGAHGIYLSPHVATSGHCIPVVTDERRGGSVGRRQRRRGNGWDEVA